MNSIEHLRYVARAAGADALTLSAEAAYALAGVARRDPKGLLTASRRLLHAQPRIGSLWWLCSQMAVASDPAAAADEAVEALRSDPTYRHLGNALSDESVVGFSGWPNTVMRALRRRGDAAALVLDVEGQGFSAVRTLEDADCSATLVNPAQIAGLVQDADVVVIEASAAGDSAMITDLGSFGLAAAAKAQRVPVWAVLGVGCRLPEPYFCEIGIRTHDEDLPPWLAEHDVVPYGLVDRLVTSEGIKSVAELPVPGCPLASELLR